MITHESQTDFAERCGVNRSTVSRWKSRERLLLNDEGLVDIDASIQRLEATRGIRHDVADRWRAYRAEQGKARAPAGYGRATGGEDHDTVDADTDAPIDLDEVGRRTRIAQMRKEEAVARQKEREDQELAGALVRRADVRKDAADATAVILSAWETLPDRVAPLLVNVDDQARIRAVLRDEVESVNRQVAEQLATVATGSRDDRLQGAA